MYIEGAVVTHIGNVRLKNEDNYNLFGSYRKDTKERIKRDTKTFTFQRIAAAVFDGLGGEEAGETASLIATEMLVPCVMERIEEDARRQIQVINEALCREMKRRGGIHMGTTMVALYLDQNMAVCCNVGDSRGYFFRDGVLQQISVDHSEAERLVRMGILSEEKAKTEKKWHMLTQHLGIPEEEFIIEPYFSPKVALRPGDVFLLCSDGLTDMVMDEEIGHILRMSTNVQEKADALVESALVHGGRDNVTALVLQMR